MKQEHEMKERIGGDSDNKGGRFTPVENWAFPTAERTERGAAPSCVRLGLIEMNETALRSQGSNSAPLQPRRRRLAGTQQRLSLNSSEAPKVTASFGNR